MAVNDDFNVIWIQFSCMTAADSMESWYVLYNTEFGDQV